MATRRSPIGGERALRGAVVLGLHAARGAPDRARRLDELELRGARVWISIFRSARPRGGRRPIADGFDTSGEAVGVNYEGGVLDAPARAAIQIAHRIGAAVGVLLSRLVSRIALGAAGSRDRAHGIGALLLAQVSCLGIGNVKLGLAAAGRDGAQRRRGLSTGFVLIGGARARDGPVARSQRESFSACERVQGGGASRRSAPQAWLTQPSSRKLARG